MCVACSALGVASQFEPLPGHIVFCALTDNLGLSGHATFDEHEQLADTADTQKRRLIAQGDKHCCEKSYS